MKKFLTIFISLALAIGIVVFLPQFLTGRSEIDADIRNNTSLVSQEIISYDNKEKTYNKIYSKGSLIGVVTDLKYLDNLISQRYKDYEKDFPDTELGLGNDVYIAQEKSYANFENVDDKIMDYLVANNLLGVKTTAVEFSTPTGVYEIIYVKNYEDFSTALEAFFRNFVTDETLQKLRNGETIASPTELGSVETNASMHENITREEAIVSPDLIFTNAEDIYQFLCYGRNNIREYYTVKEGDTLQGVGYYFGDMSPRQIVMLNPGVLSSEKQVVTPGLELNVTYYTSPITIEVTKENLSQQYVLPETPEYIEDSSLEIGTYEVQIQEEAGIKNVLYEEKWINGVLQSGSLISENVIKQPKRGVIVVGTKMVTMVGTGNYVWPVDNPYITCHYGCYFNHTGTDFMNRYEVYAPIYAVDSGVVDAVGYQYDMGNYCIINHQNGVRTFYMHLNTAPYVEVGQNVSRGQTIGQMGSTGSSTAVHLHLTFEVNGSRVNACNYLPCGLIS